MLAALGLEKALAVCVEKGQDMAPKTISSKDRRVKAHHGHHPVLTAAFTL